MISDQGSEIRKELAKYVLTKPDHCSLITDPCFPIPPDVEHLRHAIGTGAGEGSNLRQVAVGNAARVVNVLADLDHVVAGRPAAGRVVVSSPGVVGADPASLGTGTLPL